MESVRYLAAAAAGVREMASASASASGERARGTKLVFCLDVCLVPKRQLAALPSDAAMLPTAQLSTAYF